MGPELWQRLAWVFAAGGASVLVSLVMGTVLVPWFRRIGFVSRESKEGVAQGKRDAVPMGGGFILLTGVTPVVLLFTLVEQIRWGYALTFLLAFWGFALLGFLDDRSKALKTGYSDRIKVLLQVTVTGLFAVTFYIYWLRYVREQDLGLVNLPFVGALGLKLAYVPFVMVFLFYVSNAANITDGFNGLAGGTAAVVTLAYTVVTFLIGAYELDRAQALGGGLTPIGMRMFALSVMSACVAGSCLAYLYFNYHRGVIYFGDTGSMALGAALAFLALFSRTEFLLAVIGGVFFAEAASVFLQRAWIAACQKLIDPLVLARMEPTRPFIIAPLHHHFEHLMLRAVEEAGGDQTAEQPVVRRKLTQAAWLLSCGFGAIGVLGQYGLYRTWWWLYNVACVLGVLGVLAVLAAGIWTRFLYDCYFIGPDAAGQLLVLYRGVPLRLLGRRCFKLYETTDIPLDHLGYLERRTGLFRLFFSRVDARVAFGLLHFGAAAESLGEARRQHLARALDYWEKVPRKRFLVAKRHDILFHVATCYEELGRTAAAVECLEDLYTATSNPEAVRRIETLSQAALDTADADWHAWADGDATEERRAAALRGHEELLALMRIRYERALRVRDRASTQAGVPVANGVSPEAKVELTNQIETLEQALSVLADRCDQLQPAAPVAELASASKEEA